MAATPEEAPTTARADWHSLPAEEVVAALDVDPSSGLSAAEAARRLVAYGANRLVSERRLTFWSVLREEVAEPMILLLLAVGVIYALSGEVQDAVAIFLIIAGITLVEVYNEYRAKAAIVALQRLGAPTAPVLRGGRQETVPAEAVVPGDIVLLGPGERVAADLRLLAANGLRLDEASLTGESASVLKQAAPVPAGAELAERASLAFAGTLVVAGRGRGVVVATGAATELGHVAGLAARAREPRTPLQVAMRQLSGWLVWLALGFSVLVPLLGFLFGQPLREMILTGLTLAFATIPEELPILITIVLGLGALRLSRRQAIVKRLRAAETLGSVSVIASDKTGTITENHMALATLWLAGQAEPAAAATATGGEPGRWALALGTLANEATAAPSGYLGDPTDIAFLEAADAAGLGRQVWRGAVPLAEANFDSALRLTSAVYGEPDGVLLAVKGAPETVLPRCVRERVDGREESLSETDRQQYLERAAQLAAKGERVLALAYRHLPPSQGATSLKSESLVFAGLAGLLDPPRPEVPAAVAALGRAGIRVLMLTGDHPDTARAVARQIGLPAEQVLTGRDLDQLDQAGLARAPAEVAVYARITPENKLRLVEALQTTGEVVAVTGDGVNDAPALRQAAIGVAMGQTGTDAAKEAAGMVLGDDNFATISLAVREGRQLFDNLRKAVRYYLAVKVALVTTSLIAVLLHLPVPFTPIQIIVMELFMDLAASVTFTAEPAEGDVMARPPRDPRRPFVDWALQAGIFVGGASLAVAVLAAYLWAFARGESAAQAQTQAFATWMIGHALLALHMRSERQPLLSAGLLRNPAMGIWILAAVVTVLLATAVPPVGNALKTTSLDATGWLVAVAAPFLTTAWWELWKWARWRWRATS